MNQEEIYNRKQYVEQVRRSFTENADEDSGIRNRYRRCDYEENQTEEKTPGGFFKLRLIFSVLLFLVFIFLWQTDWSYKGVNAEMIQEKIETSIRLPDSFPKLSDVISILEYRKFCFCVCYFRQ